MEHAHESRSQADSEASGAQPVAPAFSPKALSLLQSKAGNQAISRLIQRKDLGKGKGGKSWMSSGNFDGKHMSDATPDEAAAKAKYTARYNKGSNVPAGNQVNTVVGEPDLKAAITDAAKVAGAYPAPRGPRGRLTVTVAGKKVFGKKTGTKQVPDRVADVASIVVEGTATDSLYFPDHIAG